jgi:hypothetical protein
MRMRGHARDLFTPLSRQGSRIVAEDRLEVRASIRREILSIDASRLGDRLQALIGVRGGTNSRLEIARVLADERREGTLLHLLVDDFAGASLVAGWALSHWATDWMKRLRAAGGGPGRNGEISGICTGFRPGSTALKSNGEPNIEIANTTLVPLLPHPEDPLGWHDLGVQDGIGMRRARRLDVWLDYVVYMDAHFQDSGTSPHGGPRIGIHEYHVTATADPKTFELLSVAVDPHVLPFQECPAAAPNAQRLLGTNLSDLRTQVLEILSGTLGCTHLNDVLRCLSDAPQLARRLHTEMAAAEGNEL